MFSKFIRMAGFYDQDRDYQKEIRNKLDRVKRNPFWTDFYRTVFSKKGFIILLVLCAILLFYGQIIDLYDKYVVNLLLARFKEGVSSGAIIFITWILSIIFLARNAREKHKFSLEITALVVAIGGLYFYYRLINKSKYDFFGTSYLKYLDLIFLFTGVFIYLFYKNDLKHFINKYLKNEEEKDQHRESFFTDIP